MTLSALLKPLDSILKKCQIRYAVIGGYAVAAWGEERATRDVDLLCAAGDSRKILREIEREGLDFEHRIGDADDPISEVIRIEMGSVIEPAEIDLLIGIRNAPPGIFDRVRTVRIENLAIPVACPEDMVILKLLGGSGRDLEDAKSIVAIQGNRIDLNLVRALCPAQIKGTLEQLLRA
jgi:predicted nucleotidyltransferase